MKTKIIQIWPNSNIIPAGLNWDISSQASLRQTDCLEHKESKKIMIASHVSEINPIFHFVKDFRKNMKYKEPEGMKSSYMSSKKIFRLNYLK
jgi:hypothetical protein